MIERVNSLGGELCKELGKVANNSAVLGIKGNKSAMICIYLNKEMDDKSLYSISEEIAKFICKSLGIS